MVIDIKWAEKIETIITEWFLGVLMGNKLNVNLYENIELQRMKWNAKGLITVKYLFQLKQLMESMTMLLCMNNSVSWGKYSHRKKSHKSLLVGVVKGTGKRHSPNWPVVSLGEGQETLLFGKESIVDNQTRLIRGK